MESLFDFENYRKFLQDWVKNQPKRGRGILKTWSELLRIEPSVLSQILNGKRDLNPDQVYELQLYLGLGELESEYFSTLVQIEKAATHKLKAHLQKKLVKLRKDSLQLSKRVAHDKILTEEQKSIFYSNWIYSAVRNATALESSQTVDSIAERFRLTRERTIEVLKFLIDSGLVIEELGTYTVGLQRTHIEKGSPHLLKHHSNWRLKAIDRAEKLTDEEMMFTGPLSISKKDFKKVREKIVHLISEVSEMVKESDPEDLAVFQVDLFWMKF